MQPRLALTERLGIVRPGGPAKGCIEDMVDRQEIVGLERADHQAFGFDVHDARTLVQTHHAVEAALQTGEGVHFADGEQRAVNVGLSTAARIMAQAELLLGQAKNDLG